MVLWDGVPLLSSQHSDGNGDGAVLQTNPIVAKRSAQR